MSEQQNISLIRSLYDAFGRGDAQFILDRLASDVEWTLEGPAIIPFAGRRKGVAQVAQYFEALAATQTAQMLSPEQLIGQGDQVAMIGRYSATVKATGKRIDTPVAHFFTLRDGKIARYLNLIDTASTADAYRAASAAAR